MKDRNVVIASTQEWGLFLSPWRKVGPNTEEIKRVLLRHGVQMIEGEDLRAHNEAIVATDLSVHEAGRLVADLRRLGLRARVGTMRSGLSLRVVAAILFHVFVIWYFARYALYIVADLINMLVQMSSSFEGSLGNLIPLSFVIWSGLCLWSIYRKGGVWRQIVADRPALEPGSVDALLFELETLGAVLPQSIIAPLCQRANPLAAHARRDPSGSVRDQLAEVVHELRALDHHSSKSVASALQEEVLRARRALHEVQARG